MNRKFLTQILLEELQEAKLELICGKLKLKSDIKILYIGSSRRSIVKITIEKYQVKIVILYIIRMLDKIVKLRNEE